MRWDRQAHRIYGRTFSPGYMDIRRLTSSKTQWKFHHDLQPFSMPHVSLRFTTSLSASADGTACRRDGLGLVAGAESDGVEVLDSYLPHPASTGKGIGEEHIELFATRTSDQLLLFHFRLGRSVPFFRPFADLVFTVSVPFLHQPLELVIVPLDCFKIVVRNLAPLFLELALELIPLTFEMIGVHVAPPLGCELTASQR
jgi:hypothetical protein